MLPTRLAAIAAISLALMSVSAKADICNEMLGRCSMTGNYAVETTSRPHKPRHATKTTVWPSQTAQTWPKEPMGAGIVVSHKTGAKARVGAAHTAVFQAYIDAVEAAGGVVRFMGGIRPGPCWSGGLHPCGMALDVCQLARGVVDRRCNLPGKTVMAAIARQVGLIEGGQWCHGDYGHAQVGGVGACRSNLYADVRKFKRNRFASVHRLQ